MGKRLFVGSLPFSVTEQKLLDLFSQYGSVASVKLISDKFSGQSKGFGFVEMGTDEEAQKAITGLNGSTLEGRTIIVNEAQPQQPRPGPRGRGQTGRRSGGDGGRRRW